MTIRAGDSLRADLTIVQGATWTRGWRFTTSGQPFIDSTWTVKAQIRASRDNATVLHEWTSSTGASITDDGTLTITVAPATSAAWPWSTAVYDLEVTKAGTTYRLLSGTVTVDREVTR